MCSCELQLIEYKITLMDWGNAIVRQKQVDGSGKVISVVMDLHLEGDFRKTKKKITWLAEPTSEHPIPTVMLTDFDYLITKKKLEEEDNVEDFVTPVTEFKEIALADANVLDLKKGDIIQFERKGYYIYDNENNGVREYFKIPDGRAAGIASKAAPPITPSTSTSAANPPKQESAPISTMYKMSSIYGEESVPEVDTKMYKLPNIYKS
jgi:glutamyl-tRNA synthetase